MIAFCGYNMSDYFAHWLKLGASVAHAPKIYLVNWFRKDANGKFVWPGFGDNMRVLKWVVERVEGKAAAKSTVLGNVPAHADLDWRGLESFGTDKFAAITAIDKAEWQRELQLHLELVEKFGATVPDEMIRRYDALGAALA
jgi:phosphoenolpyruvate carboxykinase (GTP)